MKKNWIYLILWIARLILLRRQQQTTINLNFLFENEKVGLIWLIAALAPKGTVQSNQIIF